MLTAAVRCHYVYQISDCAKRLRGDFCNVPLTTRARRPATTSPRDALWLERDSVAVAVRANRGQVGRKVFVLFEMIDEIGERHDAADRHAYLGLELLHRRDSRLRPDLLAIERHEHAGRCRARGANQLEHLANCGAGSDHVVENQHAARERSADDRAAFAVVLRLLAVVGERIVVVVMLGQRGSR